MNREVIMLQNPSGEDWIDGWDRPTSLGRFTCALNNKYFHKFDSSALRKALADSGINRSQMFLQLTAKCIPDTNVIEAIYLNFTNEDHPHAERPPEKAQEVLSDYFKSIGYPGTTCTTPEAIAAFIERMAQELPVINDYFQIR